MKIYLNPNNPRTINEDKFQKLKNSIKEFPKMLELRPIVVDKDGMILGGNMRYRALQDLGWEIKDEWVKVADQLSDEEKRRFIVEDNVGFGLWDFDQLSADYDIDELLNLGFDEAELLKDIGLDKVDDIEVDENRLFVLTVEAPESPKLKERMAFYCENIEDYKKISEFFADKGSSLNVNKLLELI